MSDANPPMKRFWLAGKREPAQDLFFKESLAASRWQAGTAEQWDTCWYTGMPGPDVFQSLTPGKTVNHIPGNNSLTIKSSLHATLDNSRRRIVEQAGETAELTERIGFFPRIYSMPGDYHALQEAALANPAQRWILKPKNSARGKGIRMLRDVATAPRDSRWMVQAYLDNPHTMNGFKYVLRLYVLVSSVEPLRVYLYNEGSAKLASARYDPDDLDNPYAHLTNPDLNATNLASASPVVFHSLAWYRSWLRDQGHDDERLFSRIRDMVAITLVCAREKMRSRLQAVNADTSGCYELLGIDCLVDHDLKPWILECNLSPSLEICAAPRDGGDVEAVNKRRLIEDMVQLLGLNETRADRSGMQPEARIRAEAEAELARAGDFHRVFPAGDVVRHLPYFPLPRLADMVLADAVSETPVPRPAAIPRQSAELILDNGLHLYDEDTGTLYAPNPSAAWIWLTAGAGANPDSVADALVAIQPDTDSHPERQWTMRREVWDTLASWAVAGLLRQGPGQRLPSTANNPGNRPSTEQAEPVDGNDTDAPCLVGATNIQVSPDHAPLTERLKTLFSPLRMIDTADDVLEILRTSSGYAIAARQCLLADNLGLARIAPLLCQLLLERSMRGKPGCALTGTLVPLTGPESFNGDDALRPALFLPRQAQGGWDLLAQALAHRIGHGQAGGILLRPAPAGSVRSIGLPARISEEDAGTLAAFTGKGAHADALRQLHEWPQSTFGHLLPADSQVSGRRYDVRTLIVPTRTSRKAGEPLLRPITDGEALAALLPASTAGTGKMLLTQTVGELTQWLADRRLLGASITDLAAAVDAITAQSLEAVF